MTPLITTEPASPQASEILYGKIPPRRALGKWAGARAGARSTVGVEAALLVIPSEWEPFVHCPFFGEMTENEKRPRRLEQYGLEVARLLDRAASLTPEERDHLAEAGERAIETMMPKFAEAGAAANNAIRKRDLWDYFNAGAEAVFGLRDGNGAGLAEEAIGRAVMALTLRDFIALRHFNALTKAWKEAIGPELVTVKRVKCRDLL